MKCHVIDSYQKWSDIRDCLDTFAGDWVFRGQRDASWQLQSTIERATSRLPMQMAEHLVHREFTRNMHAYVGPNDLPLNLLEIFALMQHHGAPTRLLDVTRSAYVACFFAIEAATDEAGSCAVWAIDEGWCKTNGCATVRKELGAKLPELKDFKMRASTIEPEHFQKIFYEEKVRMVLPVEPYRRHTRLTIQQGLFLCPGDVNRGFEGNLEVYSQENPEKHFVKIVIPNRLRAEIITDLNYMNVNRATLFPGIDGFSQSLYHSILRLEEFGQVGQRVQKRMKFGAPFV